MACLLGSPRADGRIQRPQAICLCHNPCLPTESHHTGREGGWDLGGSGRQADGHSALPEGQLQTSANAESVLEVELSLGTFGVMSWISEAISLSLELGQVEAGVCLHGPKGLGMVHWKSRHDIPLLGLFLHC